MPEERKKYLILFSFLSGFAALVYEIVWFRKLHLVFGVSSLALATVLSSFFFGIAMGSFLGGKYINEHTSVRKTAKSYAFVELLIAVSVLIVPFALDYVKPILVYFFNIGISDFSFYMIRFLLSFLILALPSIFIGATFPILLRLYVEERNETKKGVSLLYLFNTLGGFFGVIAAGFFLIKFFGMNAALGIAMFLNLTISFFAFKYGKKYNKKVIENKEVLYYSEGNKILLLLFFLSGFSALAYEIVWGRLLVLQFFGTIYSTSILIALFLLGIAIGSLLYHKFFNAAKLSHFVVLEIIVSVYAIIGLFIYGILVKQELLSFENDILKLILFAGVIVFIPCSIFGIIFPLISNYILKMSKDLGKSMGVLYSINTIGGIFGAFFAGFIFIPFFGLKNSILVLSFMSFAIAIGALYISDVKIKKYLFKLVLIFIIILFVSMSVPSEYGLDELKDGVSMPYYDEGRSAAVSVIEDNRTEKTFYRLYIDNQEVAADTPVLALDSKILAHLPLLMHENPKKVLTVGFGSGGTSYSMLLHDLDRVDAVEIEEKVIEASKFFKSLNHDVLKDKRLNIIIDDARSYLELTEEKYDVISTDVTNIRYYSNSNLYTKEYFELIKKRLNEEGVVSVWVPVSEISEEDQKILMNTFKEVFPHMSVWYMYHKLSHYLVYIGSEKELSINYSNFERRFAQKNVKNDLEEVSVTQYNLLNALFLDSGGVKEYVKGSEIHTDDKPLLEFPDLKDDGVYNFGVNIMAIYERKIDPLPYISGFESEAQKEKFVEEFRYEQVKVADNIIAGHTALLQSDGQSAALFYSRAIANADYLEKIDIGT